MHLADTNSVRNLGLGQVLKESKLHDAAFARGQYSEQLIELGAMLQPVEAWIIVPEVHARFAPILRVIRQGLIERREAKEGSGLHRFENVLFGHAGALGHLGWSRRLASFLSEVGDNSAEVEV